MPPDERIDGTCTIAQMNLPATRTLRGLAAGAILILMLGSTPPRVAQNAPAAGPDLIERGVEVYRANYCGACHTLNTVGSAGMFGPSHDTMAATALERLADPAYSGAATTAEQYTHESILDPNVYLVPGYAMTPHAMPSYSHLPAEDVDALVAMLLAQ